MTAILTKSVVYKKAGWPHGGALRYRWQDFFNTSASRADIIFVSLGDLSLNSLFGLSLTIP
jgi:hypothetical protein